MQELQNGHYSATISMPEGLAHEVIEAVENDPEENVSSLCRKALRRELQRREIE